VPGHPASTELTEIVNRHRPGARYRRRPLRSESAGRIGRSSGSDTAARPKARNDSSLATKRSVGRSQPGDRVVGIVGVPDPVPYDAQLINVDAAPAERAVLHEPASVVAKAWDQFGERACFSRRVALITRNGRTKTPDDIKVVVDVQALSA